MRKITNIGNQRFLQIEIIDLIFPERVKFLVIATLRKKQCMVRKSTSSIAQCKLMHGYLGVPKQRAIKADQHSSLTRFRKGPPPLIIQKSLLPHIIK